MTLNIAKYAIKTTKYAKTGNRKVEIDKKKLNKTSTYLI